MNYLRTAAIGLVSSCSRASVTTKQFLFEDIDSHSTLSISSGSGSEISPRSYEFVDKGTRENKQRQYHLRPIKRVNYKIT